MGNVRPGEPLVERLSTGQEAVEAFDVPEEPEDVEEPPDDELLDDDVDDDEPDVSLFAPVEAPSLEPSFFAPSFFAPLSRESVR